MNSFYTLSVEEALKKLNTTEDGLSSQEVVLRLKKFGENLLPATKRLPTSHLFFHQFTGLLIYILIASVAISFFLGRIKDAIFIIVVILINAGLGFFQEYKAERTLAFLKKVVEISAKTFRGGRKIEINANELVPGDIIFVDAGDKVPADARLIETLRLEVNEASLTGESFATIKDHTLILPDDTPLTEKKNMIFTGTFVERGKAKAVVAATGTYTEIGKITRLIKEIEEPATPLQKKIANVARLLSIGILIIIGLLIVMGFIKGIPFADIFVTGLALIVSAIPAGLPVVITIVLVVGMRRLLSQNTLVKRLNVAETLGSASVICTDKTGTLTSGEMEVSHIFTGTQDLLFDGKKLNNKFDYNGVESHITALKIALLTSEAFIENPDEELEKWRIRGRSTDKALFLAALHAGLNKEVIEKGLPLLKELPFDPTLKLSATVRQRNSKEAIVYVLGAPEIIIADSSFVDIDGVHKSLNSEMLRTLQKKNEVLAKKGLRVLGCAYRICPLSGLKEKSPADLLGELVFVGFIALKDPVRKEVKEALRLTTEAGIKTIIITGDHRYTAQAVAEELGMSLREEEIMGGEEIGKISFEELKERAKTVKLYARVFPHNKIRIVEALRANSEVVAMVGDGINDAPSINAADIGVAVGSGEDVTKEASEMVILDNNFHTLVKAVEQGRIIFENIRKVIVYLLADDFSEIFVLFTTLAFGLPIPLLPAQILFIDIIEDTFPVSSLIFGKEKNEFLMKERPRDLREPFFNRAFAKWLVAIFFIGGIALFLAYYGMYMFSKDINLTRTFVFTLTAIDSLMFALVVSSFRHPVIRRDLFSNRYLVVALICGSLLIAAAVYLPVLQGVLSTTALSFPHWLLIIGISAIELILLEITKYWFLNRKAEKE
jgi:Ca2+-transporting ATPase